VGSLYVLVGGAEVGAGARGMGNGGSKPHAFHVCITSYTLALQDAKVGGSRVRVSLTRFCRFVGWGKGEGGARDRGASCMPSMCASPATHLRCRHKGNAQV
jgi:hypothetical protein